MRALLALATLALVGAGSAAASAADSPHGRVTHRTFHFVDAVRAGQILIYDYEPGIHVRAYWRAPWRNRRYFPMTGKKPKLGRHERLSARAGSAPKPAGNFYREWWASSAVAVADVYDYYPGPLRADPAPHVRNRRPPRPPAPVKP